jgi:hypothetical protein
MMTTIIAIYGAALSTVSALLGAWYFLRSGPRLQAEAYLPEWEGLDDDEALIMLRVWNAGRGEITVNILDVTQHRGKDEIAVLLSSHELNGPEVPIRLPGHSGQEWSIELQDAISSQPSVPTTLSFSLLVGGNRHVDVPVMDGMPRRAKRPLILKPGFSQPELAECPAL